MVVPGVVVGRTANLKACIASSAGIMVAVDPGTLERGVCGESRPECGMYCNPSALDRVKLRVQDLGLLV